MGGVGLQTVRKGNIMMNPHDAGLEAAADAILEIVKRTVAGARFISVADADVHRELAEAAIDAYSAVIFERARHDGGLL